MAHALANRPAIALTLLVLIAATLRLSFFLDLRDTPYYLQHDWSDTDMAFFNQWADHLAGGDWLDVQGQHPFQNWHREVAKQHYKRLGLANTPQDAGRALWYAWYGGQRFHQEPLYPYLLGLLKAIAGGVNSMLAFQALLGVFAVVLVYLITARAFGPAAALVAGTLTLVTGPLLFYEGVLLRCTLLLVAGLSAVLAAQRALESTSRSRLVAAGLVLGGAILLKSTFLLFALVVSLSIALNAPDRKAGARRIGWLVTGLMLPLLPVVLRNLAVGAWPLSLSSVSVVTFINSNAADFVPGGGFNISSYCEPLMAAHHDSFTAAAVAAIETHSSVFAYGAFLAKKALMFWVPWEISNNANYHYYEQVSVVLGRLQLGFVWIAVPAVAGLVLARRRGQAATLLAAAVLCSYLPLVAFYNLSRFRTPLLGLLLPFAGFALVEVVGLVRKRSWRPLILAVAAPLLLAIAVAALRPPPLRVRPADYWATNIGWFQQARVVEVRSGPRAALAVVRRGLAAAPGVIRQATTTPLQATPYNRELASLFKPLGLECVRLAGLTDDDSAARACNDQVRALSAVVERELPRQP